MGKDITYEKEMSEKDEKKFVEEIKEAALEESEEKLSERQELFCQTFTTKGGLFGNGVQTYLEVYDLDQSKPNRYKTACASASRLLSNVKVFNRINELLEENGLNDVEVDKQHKFLIEQHTDLGVKMRAISEYNKLRQRIIERRETKTEVTFNTDGMTDKELDEARRKIIGDV